MFAVVELAGKQFLVSKGTRITINKLAEAEGQTSVSSDKVLALFTEDGATVEVGKPYLAGKTVTFKVIDEDTQDDKLVGAKWKRRKRYLKIFGHRQRITNLECTAV